MDSTLTLNHYTNNCIDYHGQFVMSQLNHHSKSYFYPQLAQSSRKISIYMCCSNEFYLFVILDFNLFEILKICIVYHWISVILHQTQSFLIVFFIGTNLLTLELLALNSLVFDLFLSLESWNIISTNGPILESL